ncbi:MAG: ATP-binding protein [Candidatus Latescibacteria bacterium]|jgi:K+-sensing histidine kinase KdpD|nr:ATP-binding protein [Candidatus Latescibacterota bacterium]
MSPPAREGPLTVLLAFAVESLKDAPGAVTVETSHDADSGIVILAIIDTGSGIPDDEKRLLFESATEQISIAPLAPAMGIIDHVGELLTVTDHEPEGTVLTAQFPTVATNVR